MITKKDLMLSIASIEEDLRDLHLENMRMSNEIAKLKVQLGKGECKCAHEAETHPEAKRRGRPAKANAQPRDKAGKFAKK